MPNIINLSADIIIGFCISSLYFTIGLEYLLTRDRKNAVRKTRSLVEVLPMSVFFLLFCAVIKLGIGKFEINDPVIRLVFVFSGLALIIIGTIVNISGRIKLGNNWSDEVTVYENHVLISDGVYSFIRHPLYSSLIVISLGASLAYMNLTACLAALLIFSPLMYHRAKQEEALLIKNVPGYTEYQKRVGMFFPKVTLI